LHRLGDVQDALDVKKHRKRRTTNSSPAGTVVKSQIAPQKPEPDCAKISSLQ
jgi:hypothetical protein